LLGKASVEQQANGGCTVRDGDIRGTVAIQVIRGSMGALKDISTARMVRITAAWLDPKRELAGDSKDAEAMIAARDELLANISFTRCST
jgi:hypothetical protein